MPRGDIMIRQWMVLRALDQRHYGMTLDEATAFVRTETSQHGVSDRTIRRDLRVLKDEVGFPITIEQIQARGTVYRLSKGTVPFGPRQEGAPTGLTVSLTELLALLAARELVAASPRSPFGKAFDTFFAKAKRIAPAEALRHFDSLKGAIYVRPRPGPGRKGPDWSKPILSAIRQRRILRISYRSVGLEKPAENDYEPLNLVHAAGGNYLIALRHDLRGPKGDRAANRHLKLDRIASLKMLTGRFKPPEDFDARKHLAGSLGIWQPGEPCEYVLKATRIAAQYIQESPWHESQKARRLPDGSSEIRLTLGDDHELTARILSFEGNIEVLSPPDYRKRIAESLRRMAGAYSGD